MKDIIEKISSYNLFNYLFPGIVFIYILNDANGYSTASGNVVTDLFICYFAGMIISRIGSLLVEPALKKLKLVNFCRYEDYVCASKKDEKIELLSEVNNTYRTLLALSLLLLVIPIYDFARDSIGWSRGYDYFVFLLALFIMFLQSYRKQTNYVTKRVNANLS